METLYISGGRKDKLRPGDILGALTGEAGGFQGSDVGKIEVHDRFSYVAIAKGSAERAIQQLGAGRIKGKKFKAGLAREPASSSMTHNDVLRSLRYLLNVSDAGLADIFRLGHREITRDEVGRVPQERGRGWLPAVQRQGDGALPQRPGHLQARKGREPTAPADSSFRSPTTPCSRRSGWRSSSRTTTSSRSWQRVGLDGVEGRAERALSPAGPSELSSVWGLAPQTSPARLDQLGDERTDD